MDDPHLLSQEAQTAIADPTAIIFLSAAAAWEMAIKAQAGRLSMPNDLLQVLKRNRIESLPIQLQHGLAAAKLPLHHRDPFDRMMIAQATCENLIFVTRDKQIIKYGTPCLVA